MFKSQSAQQIAERIAAGEQLQIIDIREPEEWQKASLEDAEQRAMSTFQEWYQDIPQDRDIVIMCHHGGRSAYICSVLVQQAGMTNLINMTDGINGWSQTVDKTIPQY